MNLGECGRWRHVNFPRTPTFSVQLNLLHSIFGGPSIIMKRCQLGVGTATSAGYAYWRYTFFLDGFFLNNIISTCRIKRKIAILGSCQQTSPNPFFSLVCWGYLSTEVFDSSNVGFETNKRVSVLELAETIVLFNEKGYFSTNSAHLGVSWKPRSGVETTLERGNLPRTVGN